MGSTLRAWAITAAALLVLVGFSAAVAEPLGVKPPDATMELPFEGPVGDDGLTATGEFGGELPAILDLFTAITAAGEDVTLTVIVDSVGIGDVMFTPTVEFSASVALGSVRVAMDSAGNRLITLATRPFGECAYCCTSEPDYAYTGEYREFYPPAGGPNLVYLHSRWYDPTIGRFLSPDDRLGSLVLPQDQNRYVYVVNNPMKYTDPTGHFGPALGVVAVFIATALGLSFSILYTAQWLARSATGAEQAGFLTGLALAFFVGLALSAVCAGSAMTGCVAGVLLASSILGSIIAAATYVAVTVWLGGHPTTEGFAHALMWGGVAGGAGAAAGLAIRAFAARGVNAPQAHRVSIDDVMNNPQQLRGKVPADIVDMADNARSTGDWVSTRQLQGTHKGQGFALREVTPQGSYTGRYVRWHPGGGRHGPNPYWKVSDGHVVTRVDSAVVQDPLKGIVFDR